MTKFKVGDKVKVNIKDCHNRITTIDENIVGEVVYIDKTFPRKLLQIKVHNKNLFGALVAGDIKLEKYEGGWWYEEDAILIEEPHFPLYSEEDAVKLLTQRGYEVKAPPEPLKGKMLIVKTKVGTIFGYAEGTPIASSAKIIAIVDWTEGQGV